MRLRKVAIQGFRSLSNIADFEVRAPTVLAGHNDAGKSSLLEAVGFLLDSYTATPEDFSLIADADSDRVDTLTVVGTFELSSDEVETLGLESPLRVRRIATPHEPAALQIELLESTNELLRGYEGETNNALTDRIRNAGLSMPAPANKSDLLRVLREAADAGEKRLQWAAAPRALAEYLPRVQSFTANSMSSPEDAIRENLQAAYKSHLETDKFKGRISTIERKLEQKLTRDAQRLLAHIKARVSGAEEFVIEPKVNLRGSLASVSIAVLNAQNKRVGLGKMGTGLARRVAFAVWEQTTAKLADSARDVVLLYDEPDTHLDYHHQREFMGLVREQAGHSNVAILIATHSMNLIDGVDIADVLHVTQDETLNTTVQPLGDDSGVGTHLGAIAASVGLRNTVLLHERLFVGVEGDTETRSLPVLFRLVTGRHLQSSGIAIWSGGNNDGALRFAQFLVKNGRNVLLFVDTDSLEVKPFRNDGVARFDLTPSEHLLTIGARELEDIFTDEQWAQCANAHWQRTDDSPWGAAHFAPHRAGKFSSGIEKMLREESRVEVSGKPTILATLAMSLTDPSQVPAPLRDAFQVFIDRAG